ncbi:MAG: thioredoxin family protein [Proteobacteria bacterium]|nr:thioredoxin family protein [Pseudomonadota bacterium]
MTIKVELFSAPGCNRCAHAKAQLQRIVEEIDSDRLEWRFVDVLDEIDYAVAIGVLSTPAIAVDGKLVFTSLPSGAKLRRSLEDRLAQEAVNHE